MQVGYFGAGLLRGLLFGGLGFFLLFLPVALAEHHRRDHEQHGGDYCYRHAAGFIHPQQDPFGFDQSDDQHDKGKDKDVEGIVNQGVHELGPVFSKLNKHTLLLAG